MSNIHSPSGWHGVDDEFNHGLPNRCPTCWGRAKKTFFDPERPRRRGVSLNGIYSDIHSEAHDQGNRH